MIGFRSEHGLRDRCVESRNHFSRSSRDFGRRLDAAFVSQGEPSPREPRRAAAPESYLRPVRHDAAAIECGDDGPDSRRTPMSEVGLTADHARELAPPASGRVVRLALQVLAIGMVCHLSTEIGFAHKLPPHNISALWPTGAILFSVLVATPARHWWLYTVAAYFTSVINDARAGFPTAAVLFIAAGLLEILLAAVAVRRWAGGVRAFFGLRSLVIYLAVVFF